MKTVLFLSGTSLSSSANARLATLAANLAQDKLANHAIIDEINLMSLDLPPAVKEALSNDDIKFLIERVCVADAFFICSDEYTGTYSTQLRCALAWIAANDRTEANLLKDKPVVLCGITTMGIAGLRGFPSLMHLLTTLDARVIPLRFHPGPDNGPLSQDGQLGLQVAEQLMQEALLPLLRGNLNTD